MIKKKEKGITLIALVVTIVVLLILAGISISMLTGENGVITQAKQAEIENNHASVLEAIRLEVVSYKSDSIMDSTTTDILEFLKNEGKIDENNIVNVKNTLQKKLSTGNGSGNSDVYVIEKNEAGEYELFYYDKSQNPRDLGYLIKDENVKQAADSKYFDITEDGEISIKREYGYYRTGDWDNWTLEELVIPSEVDGITVTSIADGFMGGNEKIKKVYLSDSIIRIGDSAFLRCRNLTSITIPDSVISIGYRAFNECSSLTSITIPDSVTSIGYGAFNECSSLTSITIPDSVTSIGWYAFSGCSSLTSITIPGSVTSIGDYAFEDCSSLTSITIPDSVTSIEYGAFEDCSSLTSITIPDSVTRIGDYAFYDCSSLTTVNYTGTEEQWNKISISSSGNSSLTNATKNYNYTK